MNRRSARRTIKLELVDNKTGKLVLNIRVTSQGADVDLVANNVAARIGERAKELRFTPALAADLNGIIRDCESTWFA